MVAGLAAILDDARDLLGVGAWCLRLGAVLVGFLGSRPAVQGKKRAARDSYQHQNASPSYVCSVHGSLLPQSSVVNYSRVRSRNPALRTREWRPAYLLVRPRWRPSTLFGWVLHACTCNRTGRR